MDDTFPGGIRILDLSGGLLLDLHGGGYDEASLSEDTVTWRRETVTSPWVDGDFETTATKDAGKYALVVHIFGATWAQVEQRRLALQAAVSSAFLLEVTLDGVTSTYRASRADFSAPRDGADVLNRRRLVAMSIPVQPNPTMTGA